jgi:hypothetical protein
MVKETITELPHPEVLRKPIVDAPCDKGCKGQPEIKEDKKVIQPFAPDCSKIFKCDDGKQVCVAYEDPAFVHRHGKGCALGDNHPEITKEQAMILKRKFGRKRRNRI